MLAEPRLVRIERPSRQIALVIPHCKRCGKRLWRRQEKYCSHRCAQNAWWWKKRLELYWRAAG